MFHSFFDSLQIEYEWIFYTLGVLPLATLAQNKKLAKSWEHYDSPEEFSWTQQYVANIQQYNIDSNKLTLNGY